MDRFTNELEQRKYYQSVEMMLKIWFILKIEGIDFRKGHSTNMAKQ